MDPNPPRSVSMAALRCQSGVWRGLAGIRRFIVAGAWKLLSPTAWRWRHWTTYVLAWAALVLVAVTFSVALIATLVGWLNQA
jgi:hypothetical protein